MEHAVIPLNEKGKQNDMQVERILETQADARKVFTRAWKRLLNPKIWNELAGYKTTVFNLVDARGKKLRRLIREKDFIRINIPGPGPKTGDGFDWVQLDLIDDRRNRSASRETLAIRLNVSANPIHATNDTAHFFDKGASSSFQIKRQGNQVTAAYHGRNETINNKTGSVVDNIRNTVVGAGALIGLSELQWKTLIEGFLSDEIGA